MVVRDPEKCKEDFSFKGAGECERHECPYVGEWVVARLSHGDEHFVGFGLLSHTRWRGKRG